MIMRKVVPRSARLIWSPERVKCGSNCSKNWAKYEILPARGTRSNKKKLICILKKKIVPKGVRLQIIWSAEK